MRRVPFWLAIGMVGISVPAAADTLALFNCTTEAPFVTTFNESDPVCAIPRLTTALHACSTLVLVCDGRCKVDASQRSVGLGSSQEVWAEAPYPILSRERTYTRSGELMPTDSVRNASDEAPGLSYAAMHM